MLIQVLRDLISLFVEVKIKLFDSKRFLIKWNFQLPCEHLVHAAISKENHHHSLQGWKTSPSELCPWCWEEQRSGAPHTCPQGSIPVPAPHLSSSCKPGLPPELHWEPQVHQDTEKIHPILQGNRPRHKGEPRIQSHPPAEYSSHPKTSLRSSSCLKTPLSQRNPGGSAEDSLGREHI